MKIVEFVVPTQPPAGLLARLGPFFRESYGPAPWAEYWRCPVCSPPDDFGPTGCYGDPDLKYCPVCHAPLEPYWSDDRVGHYFRAAMARPGAWLIIGWSESTVGEHALAAWSWGYGMPPPLAAGLNQAPDGLYADIVGVLPEYRRRGGGAHSFFVSCRDLLLQRAPYVVVRTHTQARHVRLLLRRAGWHACDVTATADPTREYWVINRPSS